VLQPDRRNDRNQGLHQVGSIHPAAETNLDHRAVHFFQGEMAEGQGGEHLEVGRTVRPEPGKTFDHRGQFLDPTGEIGPADRTLIDLDALPGVQQVRGGVKTDPEPGGLKKTGRQAGGRPFAVGPGHVENLQASLGLAESGQQTGHVGQSQPYPETLAPLQKIDRLTVSHC